MPPPAPYYDHDGITIYCGDSRKIAPMLARVDLAVIDPPYGHGDKWAGGTWAASDLYDTVESWDATPVEQSLIDMLVGNADRAVVWGGNYYAMPPSRCWLAWEKTSKMPTMADFELAWTNLDRPAKMLRCRRNQDGKRVHPTQKPVRLIRWCIEQAEHAGPVSSVLDGFMGSGTTLVAARELGKQAIGIEIDEHYCAEAVTRLRQQVFSFG